MPDQGEMTLQPEAEEPKAEVVEALACRDTRASNMAPIEQEQPSALAVQPSVMDQMLQKAIADGCGIEVLERLHKMRKEERAEDAKMAFRRAMAEFKAHCTTVITRNRQADVYTYADLAHIYETVVPDMARFGLTHDFETPDDLKPGHVVVTCVITHELGHSKRVSLPLEIVKSTRKLNTAQLMGSTITFLMRYTFGLAIGLAMKDDDGKASGQPQGQVEDDKKRNKVRASQKAQRKKAKADGKNTAPASKDPASPMQLQRLLELAEHESLSDEQRKWLIGIAENTKTTSGQAWVARQKAEEFLRDAAGHAGEEPPPDSVEATVDAINKLCDEAEDPGEPPPAEENEGKEEPGANG